MRRHRANAAAAIVLMVMLPATMGGQNPDVPGQVDRAIRQMLSPDSSDAQCMDGIVTLLDAIIATAPAAGLDAAWAAKISATRDLAARGRTLAPDTFTLLNDGYRAVHGKPFKVPPAIRSVEDARTHMRGQLSSVRALLAQGRADEAVRRMLEAILLVVTPLEA